MCITLRSVSLGAVFFILCFPALGSSAEKARFAYPSKSLNFLPLYIGKDKGIFHAEGIDMEPVQVNTQIASRALLTDNLDFSAGVTMSGAAAGMPIKVVAFMTVKPSFWIVTKPQIQSVHDLKGKIIGISAPGSASDLLARHVLRQHGLNPDKDVSLIPTGATSNNLAALKAGTVDAGIFSPPFHAMAKQLGFRFLLYVGDYVDQSLSGVVATEKMIKEKPDVVKRVLRGTIKSLRYINNNGVDTTRYIAAGWKVEPALAAELYESMLRAYSPDGGMAEKAIREMMDREQERMGLKEQVPLARVVDLRLLKEVQKE